MRGSRRKPIVWIPAFAGMTTVPNREVIGIAASRGGAPYPAWISPYTPRGGGARDHALSLRPLEPETVAMQLTPAAEALLALAAAETGRHWALAPTVFAPAGLAFAPAEHALAGMARGGAGAQHGATALPASPSTHPVAAHARARPHEIR